MSPWVVLAHLNGSSCWKEAEVQATSTRQHGSKGLFTMNNPQWPNSKTTLLRWSSGTNETRRLSQEAKETVHSRTRTQLTRVMFVKQIMANPVVKQPPYSPNMAPREFWLFHQI